MSENASTAHARRRNVAMSTSMPPHTRTSTEAAEAPDVCLMPLLLEFSAIS